jgi:hypothetical protein
MYDDAMLASLGEVWLLAACVLTNYVIINLYVAVTQGKSCVASNPQSSTYETESRNPPLPEALGQGLALLDHC